MALTITEIMPGGSTTFQNFPEKYQEDRKRQWFNVAADANYPAGGYPLTPALCALANAIDFVTVANGNAPGNPGLNYWFWNRATQKLQLIVLSTGVETAVADQHLSNTDIIVEGY